MGRRCTRPSEQRKGTQAPGPALRECWFVAHLSSPKQLQEFGEFHFGVRMGGKTSLG